MDDSGIHTSMRETRARQSLDTIIAEHHDKKRVNLYLAKLVSLRRQSPVLERIHDETRGSLTVIGLGATMIG